MRKPASRLGLCVFRGGEKLKNDDLLAGIASTGKVPQRRIPRGFEYLEDRFPDVETGCRFWLAKSPVRLYPGFPLPASVSQADKARLLDCAQYLQTETNMLYYRSDTEQLPLSVPGLAKRLHMHPRNCYRFIQRMIDARVMARQDGRLYINPIYFFRGVRLKSHLFFLFERDLTSILPTWTVEKFTGLRR